MILKIASFIFSHLLGNSFSNPDGTGQYFSDLTFAAVRKIVLLVSGVIAGFFLFVGGFFTVLLDLILTSREHQQLLLSPVSVIGFALMSVSILTAVYLFRRQIWTVAPPKMEKPQTAATPLAPVADALAEMIRDMTEERRYVRQREMKLEMQMDAAAAQAGASANIDFSDPSRPAYN